MMDESITAVTTFDNPYSPFDDLMHWSDYDELHGYHTCSKLARISDSMGKKATTEECIDELIRVDALNLYLKVTEEDYQDGILIMDKERERFRDAILDRMGDRIDNA